GISTALFRLRPEVTGLAEIRADAAYLHEKPLQHFVLLRLVLRQELAGLAGEINQDRPGFENRQRLAAQTVPVDDRGDFVVRTDLEKFRFELVAPLDVDRMRGVWKAGFLKHDMDFAAIRGRPTVNVDHAPPPASHSPDGKR